MKHLWSAHCAHRGWFLYSLPATPRTFLPLTISYTCSIERRVSRMQAEHIKVTLTRYQESMEADQLFGRLFWLPLGDIIWKLFGSLLSPFIFNKLLLSARVRADLGFKHCRSTPLRNYNPHCYTSHDMMVDLVNYSHSVKRTRSGGTGSPSAKLASEQNIWCTSSVRIGLM